MLRLVSALQHLCMLLVLLNCPQATEWCVPVCATLAAHVALILTLCVPSSFFPGFAIARIKTALLLGQLGLHRALLPLTLSFEE